MTFEINEGQLRNMYDSFSHASKYTSIFGGKDKEDGYKLASQIDFNAFKIFFEPQLKALGLDTRREV
jgi:hypothetical protein